MGVRESLGHLARDAERLGDRHLDLASEPVSQALALDVRHRIIEEAVGLAGVVERENVRMVEPGRDPDLAEEALRAE
jgi:hypothetical protein